MIKLKLNEIAQKLGKNSSEIARETGINRNTINALMHDRVEGIKFPTIEKICQTYSLTPMDLLEYIPEGVSGGMPKNIYHQQTYATPFYVWPVVLSTNRFPKEYFKSTFGPLFMFIKNEDGHVYWDADQMNTLAKEVYEQYSNPLHFERLYRVFERNVRDVEKFYNTVDLESLKHLSKKELTDYFTQVFISCRRMYGYCYFTEAYYAGFDHREIKRLTEKHGFSPEEVLILLAPEELTYDEDRRLALLSLLTPYRDKRKFDVRDFVRNDSSYQAFVREFLYGEMDYRGRKNITEDDRVEEVEKYLSQKDLFDEQYQTLASYSKTQKKRIADVCRAHGLQQNPLWFFNRVAFWREAKKHAILMGVYVLDQILFSLEARTGVSKDLLRYLSYEEFDGMLKGLVQPELLKERKDNGLLIEVRSTDYTFVLGQEAESMQEELHSRISGDVPVLLYGNMVSRGFARGVVRLVQSKKDAEAMKRGEVAVLDKDVFLSLVLDKALAVILTQEKLSAPVERLIRQYEVPCVTGVPEAVKKIKNGDVVEVRANHRTVRIMKK